MPYDTPTLPSLIGQAQSELVDVDGLRHSDAQVTARVQAGGLYGLYGYLNWIFAQMLPDTCDEAMLLRYGDLRPIAPRNAAVAAAGGVIGGGIAGSVLDAGTLLQRSDGAEYRVTTDVTLTDSTVAATVEALVAGAAGNCGAGTKLMLVSPVTGLLDEFVVEAGGITGGTEAETLDAYRVRVLRSYRVLAHGGNTADYETWALEVAGVTRAWVKRNWIGPGTVGVFVMRDGDADPFPTADALALVQAYLDARRPVTADVYALAPVPAPVDYDFRLTPDTTATRTAAEAALRGLHASGVTLGGTLKLTDIDDAVKHATGVTDFVRLAPLENVAVAGNALATFGSAQWA